MKKYQYILISLLLISNTLTAQNLTQVSVDKAREVIDQVVEAYGGSERLNKLNSVMIDFETSNLAVNQSKKPGPPWDVNKVKDSSMVDFENQQFVSSIQSNDERNFHNGIIINGDKSFQVDFLAKTATPIAEPNFMNTAGSFIRVTPALLVKQLMQRANTAHYLGQADVDGKPHDVVTLVMEVGPAISLYFDQETHLLNKSERFFGVFGMVGYRFHEYKKVDGIPFNGRFELFVSGENNMKRHNVRTQINQPIAKHTQLSDKMAQVAPVQPDPLARQEISDGVYLIGGNGTYALFVEMDDHVIAIGGTAGIPERIGLLKEVVPNKPIKYGVLTHHHGDHIVGGQAYAEEGTIILTAAAHEQVVRDSIEHDSYKLETIKDQRTFTGKQHELQIIDVGPTDHAEHILVAYLPKAGILFQADHFGLRSPGNINPAGQATQDFAQSLKKHKIKAKSILSAHSALVATDADLNTALKLAKELVQKD
ncbi:hypothetical protein MNBD_GAMMA02-227 [hydrothermal vent metagenome]|uniref:Metallo-beta-lactamase domain-containing protein n=1 Tax=hydrothermal vent metagenome TaxID=652676 RepID=A0A3B0WBL3_9ZZZZ